jgi:hypothetical protein
MPPISSSDFDLTLVVFIKSALAVQSGLTDFIAGYLRIEKIGPRVGGRPARVSDDGADLVARSDVVVICPAIVAGAVADDDISRICGPGVNPPQFRDGSDAKFSVVGRVWQKFIVSVSKISE